MLRMANTVSGGIEPDLAMTLVARSLTDETNAWNTSSSFASARTSSHNATCARM